MRKDVPSSLSHCTNCRFISAVICTDLGQSSFNLAASRAADRLASVRTFIGIEAPSNTSSGSIPCRRSSASMRLE
eukprot:scaffold53411_cov26-Tisochrysis_lutea.AAC.1